MIGDRLRNFRKQNNITLQMLSEKTNLSIGYLSNIERNITSPNIEHLQTICNALEADLIEIIQSALPFETVIRYHERPPIEDAACIGACALLTDENLHLYGFAQTILQEEFTSEAPIAHDTDELGIIIEGCISVKLHSTIYQLQAGDTIYIKAHTPHHIQEIHTAASTVYWIRDNTQLCKKGS